MSEFVEAKRGEALSAGMALRVGKGKDAVLLRVTHVFQDTIYAMPYTSANEARLAKRPHCLPVAYVKTSAAVLGRIRIPAEATAAGTSTQANELWEKIHPLVEAFKLERNLHRWEFTKLIAARADALDMSAVTLRKVLLRYFYHGEVKAAILGMRPGPGSRDERPKGAKEADETAPKRKRPARQPREAAELGRNDFIVEQCDIDDMLAALRRLAEEGVTTIKAAYDDYFDNEFRERHPEEWNDWHARRCPKPVTYKVFYNKIKEHEALSTAARKNVDALEHGRGAGGLVAAGPGEIYEIDATGGRIHIPFGSGKSAGFATPTIYLLIDRWSRYVVSVYLTLGRPSWEEIRYALLIAFTEREERFGMIGVNVTSKRWPVGRVCATLVRDRGSEMISSALLDSVVEDLRITARTLPAFCADGKGIIERLNRTIKAKMAEWGLKGVFARRPTDAPSRKAFRDSKDAAAPSLAHVYRELIEIIVEYNNSVHKTLEKRAALKLAGVEPTPQAAYQWGLENLTGIKSPPLTDDDYRRLLLGFADGTIKDRRVFWRERAYKPVNAAALRRARKSTHAAKPIKLRIDRSSPVTIYSADDWGHWHVDDVGLRELRAMTLAEEDGLHDAHALAIALAKNDADRRRSANARGRATRQAKKVPASHAPARVRESSKVKAGMVPKPKSMNPAPAPKPAKKAPSSDWQAIDAAERKAIIERQNRKRK